MLISIVVPCYNHEKLLGTALLALLKQNHKPDEILIVDDKSTDGSLDISKSFAERYPSIKIKEHERNLGAPSALNTGLKHARGEFVLFAGADDITFPDLLSLSLRELEKNPSAALCCSEMALFDNDHNILGFRPIVAPSWRTRYLSPAEVSHRIKRSDNWISGVTAVYRRSYLMDIGGFDASLGAFCDGFASRLLSMRHGFCFIPEVLAGWRVNKENFSVRSALDIKKNKTTLQYAIKLLDKLAVAGPDNNYKSLLAQRWKFDIARMLIKWGDDETVDRQMLIRAIDGTRMDQWALRMLAHLPRQDFFMLSWLAMRLKPVTFHTLIQNLTRHALFLFSRQNSARQIIMTAEKYSSEFDSAKYKLQSKSHTTIHG